MYYFLAFVGIIFLCSEMLLLIRSGISTLIKHTHKRIVLLFFIIFLALGGSIFDDYGFSWDESTQRHSGRMNFNYIFKGDKELFQDDNENERYYGTVFEIFLIFLEKGADLYDTRNIYLMRHFATFLLFFVGVFFFYLLCQERFQDWKIGLLGSLFLIVSPRIFAHAFYNSKDLPFLSLFIISMYALVKYLEQKTWVRASLHALSCAILINIRILGIIVPCFTILFILGDTIARATTPKKALISIIHYSSLLLILTILSFPVLWENPVYHFLQAFSKMRKYPWDAEVFYLGKFIRSTELPWHYIPVWIIITTPIIYLVSFIIGLALSAKSLLQRPFYTNYHSRNDLLFLLWFFLPVLALIAFHSVVYDAWRHVFFIYPAFLLIALHGVVFLLSRMKKLFQKNPAYQIVRGALICIIVLSLANIIYFMLKNHPYQNVYFNRLAGKNMSSAKKNFELDYWGLSYRQALEYILTHDAREHIKIYAAQEVGKLTAVMFNAEDRKRVMFVDNPKDADYFASNYRWQKEEYPYKNEWYAIEVDGAKIMVVYKLNG